MNVRTIAAWAGFCLATLSLTGCTSPSNNNYMRPNTPTGTQAKGPVLGQPTATAPAASSGWARNNAATQNPAQGSPSALAQPMGNSPQFTNMPSGGITPSGGLAPPVPISNGPAAGPTLPGSGTTSNMLPSGQSMNNLNAGTPVAGAATANRQVATNAARADKVNLRVSTPAPTAEESSAPAPPMPPAPAGSELPIQTPSPITSLSPVTLQPTKVRQ